MCNKFGCLFLNHFKSPFIYSQKSKDATRNLVRNHSLSTLHKRQVVRTYSTTVLCGHFRLQHSTFRNVVTSPYILRIRTRNRSPPPPLLPWEASPSRLSIFARSSLSPLPPRNRHCRPIFPLPPVKSFSAIPRPFTPPRRTSYGCNLAFCFGLLFTRHGGKGNEKKN